MTPAMKRILEELGRMVIARKPSLEEEWKTLMLISTSPGIADFLDRNFPVDGGWGIRTVSRSPEYLQKEYPL